jgi:ABC-type transport system substrate-binding protein
VADAAANAVTFHLTTPNPDLPYQLALPPAFAIAPGTPLKAHVRLPATGPYMIKPSNAKRGLVLARNPRFHEWSPAAQPRGYPDAIVWKRRYASSEAEVNAVERGEADLITNFADLAPRHLAALRTGHASQLHISPRPINAYFGLNTRVPPFNDVRVRRAVNYAFDRNEQIDRAGGTAFASVSCQVLPPNVAGYRRYCPYTIDPRPDGTYTGPDLEKARKLVAATGTKGQKVTVWIGTCCSRFAALLVSALNNIGYKGRLHIVKDFDVYSRAIADSRRRIQAFGQAWTADYVTANGFIPGALSCDSFLPGSAKNPNLAEFCNPTIDAEIARARTLQTSDPLAASKLWTKIDHDLVDQAPWVSGFTPNLAVFVSRRVGNYQDSPQWGPLLDQLWVR